MGQAKERIGRKTSRPWFAVPACVFAAVSVVVVGHNVNSKGDQAVRRMSSEATWLRIEVLDVPSSNAPSACDNDTLFGDTWLEQHESSSALGQNSATTPTDAQGHERTAHLAQFQPGNGAMGAQGATRNGNGPGAARNGNNFGNNSQLGAPGGNGQGGVCISPAVRLADECSYRLAELRLNALRSMPTESNLFSH